MLWDTRKRRWSWRWMTSGASSERSAAQTSYEVSGLRFCCVLTVYFERLSWVPCWGPAIPPPPIPPRLLSGPSCRQPRMVRRGQYGPPKGAAKGNPGPFRPKGPLNGRNACRRIFIPAPSSTHPDPSSRVPIHFTLTVVLRSSWICDFFGLFSRQPWC